MSVSAQTFTPRAFPASASRKASSQLRCTIYTWASSKLGKGQQVMHPFGLD